jgi:hypothetical protein
MDKSSKHKGRLWLEETVFRLLPASVGTDLALPVSDEADARQRDMTLYIACNSDSGTRHVRLEGWLEGDAVAELERVISGDSGPLRLDLSELRSADAAGLAALRALRAAGASLVGASPYIRLLLGS